MAIIFDDPATIGSTSSLRVFEDTGGKNVWYAPTLWKLSTISGQAAISYYNNSAKDVSFLQMVVEGWIDQSELDSISAQARARGGTITPVNFLGKSDAGVLGSKLTVLQEFPEDNTFRFKVNGGQGGSFAGTIPIVLSMNSVTGEIIADEIRTKGIGLVMQFGGVIRGVQSTMDATVTIDYDKCYEVLQTHVSWHWWVVSGDIQAAWQSLTETGAVRVHINGGTADQKAIVYKTAEFLRDLFLKPSLSTVTAPAHPDGGIVNVSVRYEKINEHKHFEITFKEREYIDSSYNVAAVTMEHKLGGPVHLDASNAMTFELLTGITMGSSLVDADFISMAPFRVRNRIKNIPALAHLLDRL